MVVFAGQEGLIWAERPAVHPLVSAGPVGLEGFYKADPMRQEVIQQPSVMLAPSLWLSDVLMAEPLVQTVEYFGGFGAGGLGLWWAFSQ